LQAVGHDAGGVHPEGQGRGRQARLPLTHPQRPGPTGSGPFPSGGAMRKKYDVLVKHTGKAPVSLRQRMRKSVVGRVEEATGFTGNPGGRRSPAARSKRSRPFRRSSPRSTPTGSALGGTSVRATAVGRTGSPGPTSARRAILAAAGGAL